MGNHNKITKFLFLITIPFFLSACETLNVQTIGTSTKFTMEDDEARLWKRQDELENILKDSGFIYQDEQLIKYVNEVLNKLISNVERVNNVDIRAYIIKDPLFNAFCLCNGAIFIHTSLLATADNEAQLATVLGHEASHFLYRHELKGFRSLKNKTAFFSTVEVTLAGASSHSSTIDLFRLLTEYGVVGAYYGYSREMEREADKNAFELVINNGYDPQEAKKFLEHMYEVDKDEDFKVPYFYSTHPRVKERIRDYEDFIKDLTKKDKGKLIGIQNTEVYNAMTRNVLGDNIELEIKANHLKLARRQIEKYNKLYPNNFKGHFFLGSVDFLEDKKDEAGKEFKQSIELNPQCPECHKALGTLYYKKGEKQLAKIEFEKYLQLNPQAKDANYIMGYLNE